MDEIIDIPSPIDPQYRDEELDKSISMFYLHAATNTPYYGYIGKYDPELGWLLSCDYNETHIVVARSDDDHPDYLSLDEKLEMANTLTGIVSFVSTAAGTAQANDLFYIDDAGKVIKTNISPKTGQPQIPKSSKEMAKVGKGFGKAISYVNIGITATQLAREGWNINTGSDTIVCAIGFFPGVGWVISGIYTIANVVSYATTGKSYMENKRDKLFDTHCRFNVGLENLIRRWFSCGGYINPGF